MSFVFPFLRDLLIHFIEIGLNLSYCILTATGVDTYYLAPIC